MEIMKLKIKNTEALSVLATLYKMEVVGFEVSILKSLDERGFLNGMESCGKTIKELQVDSESKLSFMPIPTSECLELIDSLIIWGDGSEFECEECGCEMDDEHDSHGNRSWTNFKCPNPECGFGISNEPDWDTMPGGKDFY